MKRLKLKSNLKSTRSTKSSRVKSKKKVSFNSYVSKPHIDILSHYTNKKTSKKSE